MGFDIMLYIEPESTDAAFHFSVEEYIVRDYPWNTPVMMIWQADKCAMLGSNQIAEAEIDMSRAAREGIKIVRRSSGGGTIFTDMGTLLYTVILPDAKERYPLDLAREKVAGPVVEALNKMGVPAKAEGRNDILVNGKKVSGMAQYVRHGRICTHGSLLYDADLDLLSRVLRVDDEKISSKALRSIRSRVTNIKEYIGRPCSTGEFRELLKQNLFCGLDIKEHKLSDRDHQQIGQIFREKYGNPSWTFEQSPKFSFHNSKRFAGGKVEVFLDVVKGTIASCSIRGDFLGVVPIQGIEQAIVGLPFRFDAIAGALDRVPMQPYLGNITKEELLSCIFD